METLEKNIERPGWGKIIFVTLGVASLLIVFLWKWWLGVLYFLIIYYGVKRVSYSMFFILFALMALLGFASLFL